MKPASKHVHWAPRQHDTSCGLKIYNTETWIQYRDSLNDLGRVDEVSCKRCLKDSQLQDHVARLKAIKEERTVPGESGPGEKRFDVIDVGLGGFGGQNRLSNSRTSGYSSNPEELASELHNNGVIIDKRAILRERPGLAITEPMLTMNPDVSRFSDIIADPSDSIMCTAMMSDPGNAFGTMLKIASSQNTDDYGALDQIPLSIYCARWLKYGAVIGVRRGNKVEWSNGKVQTL